MAAQWAPRLIEVIQVDHAGGNSATFIFSENVRFLGGPDPAIQRANLFGLWLPATESNRFLPNAITYTFGAAPDASDFWRIVDEPRSVIANPQRINFPDSGVVIR